ncbi:vWA domain-containing protein [Gordonia sp. DT219]|uniref:vWA domain-containing protein n=1 Tax=Gordonia sp. DT219 TaxID=3416658 RepID=UPI003CE72A34
MTAGPDTAPFVAHLTDFVDELRRRGVVVGPSNLIDAARAVEVLDLLDRRSLREGLAATLLDDHLHRTAFDRLFDLWFPAAPGARSTAEELPRTEDGAVDIAATRDELARVLADPDAESDGRLDAMVAEIVEVLGRYESARGDAYSAYQALSSIEPQTLIARIAAAMAGGRPAELDVGTEPMFRRAARDRAAVVRAAIERETQRRMSARNGRERVGEYAVPKLPENIAFLTAGAREQAELRRTVDPLARLLASRLETRRRRARRGPADVRATLRASMSTGGVPIELRHRKPRPGRPELIVICDVSGSVAGFSAFTLNLVYALRQQFSKVRVFAFIDSVDEVTDLFDPRNDADAGFGGDTRAAMSQMIETARLIIRDGHSDYGNMLRGFVGEYAETLTHRGALLILGDARTNFGFARTELLAQLVERARHAYWLNPEPGAEWGTGDSVADEYAEVIDMFECRNARQLATVIGDLLPV